MRLAGAGRAITALVCAVTCAGLVVGAVVWDEGPSTSGGALVRDTTPQDGVGPPVPTSHRSTEVEVPTRRGPRPGTLLVPVAPGPVPGVVMVAGSGAGRRSGSLAVARSLAARGVAVLVVDKNTRGYSFLQRDYDALGRDASDAASWLRQRSGVDPSAVGLWGTSEGGWVSASAAAADPRVAFLVLVSAPTVTPGQQLGHAVTRWSREHRLGWAADLLVLQLTLGDRVLGYPTYRAPLADVEQPVLAVFGAEDPTVPVAEAVSLLRREVAGELSLHVLARTGHSITSASGTPRPDHVDLASWWVRTRSPVQRVEAPVPPSVVPPAPDARPGGPAAMLLAGQVAGTVSAVLAAGPLLRAVSRRRRTARGSRRAPGAGSRRARAR